MAGVGCGSDSSSSKSKEESSGSSWPAGGGGGGGGSGGGGDGPSYAKTCEDAAAAMLRAAICAQSNGTTDVKTDKDKVPDYQEQLEKIVEGCKENKPENEVGCKTPNTTKMKEYYDAVAGAASCEAIGALESKQKEICSTPVNPGPGPGNNGDIDWMGVCKADVEIQVRDEKCDKLTEAEMLSEIGKVIAAECKNVEEIKEWYSGWCDTPNEAAFKKCASSYSGIQSCDQLDDVWTKEDGCHYNVQCPKS